MVGDEGLPLQPLRQLARGAVFRPFFVVQRPGRQLQKVLDGRMTILTDECDRAVIERGQDHSAA